MKNLLIALMIIVALALVLPPELTRILCLGWIGLFMFWGMIRVSMPSDKQPESEPEIRTGEWWQTDHEKTNPHDALAEMYASSGVYWDKEGHRHREEYYTRQSGERVTIKDEIIYYNDIEPRKVK